MDNFKQVLRRYFDSSTVRAIAALAYGNEGLQEEILVAVSSSPNRNKFPALYNVIGSGS